jgi:hypothetical protein
MEEVNSKIEKPKFNMFDFVDDGKGGKTLYNCLSSITGISDWSTESLVYNALPMIDISKENENMKKFMVKEYEVVFDKLTKNINTIFSGEEREFIFEQLNSVNPDKYNFESFSTCLDFLKENRYNSSIENPKSNSETLDSKNDSISEQKTKERNEYLTINNIILGNIMIKMKNNVEYGNDPFGVFQRTLLESRNNIFKAIYFPKINNDVKRMAPDRANTYYQDVEEILFALRVLIDPKKMAEYDDYLQNYQKESNEAKQKIALKSRCEAKRKSFVKEEIKKALPENIKNKITNSSGIEKIFYDPTKKVPEKNSYEWSLNQREKPILLVDGKTTYSQNGDENQRVIAIGYGGFEYNDPNFNYSSSTLELVGITKKGADGIKNYFILMPLENLKLKKDYEVSHQDNIVPVFGDAKMLDLKSKIEWQFVEGNGIPKGLEEFYKNVIMSDEYLKNAEFNNYRFAGYVNLKDNKPELRTCEDWNGNKKDFEVCKFAALYPGNIISTGETKKVESISKFVSSPKFYAKHLQLVEEIVRGKRDKVYVSKGIRNQEGDER